ncbi:MAG TPA: tRNA (N6-threonylcarbamoyladenosine(37)-N6)-methyltransferase TrmO [Candidatus Omnitrophica bacterium]|nr:tRNA (N6-threonylcarbamoyladenosine(37)-N6)-methyltransferase TrmO [Candidatus Omnitrophota bacterium]
MFQEITYKVIGVIHSPFESPKGTPIQPRGARGVRGEIVLKEEYKEGLKDLEGFSHIILVYHFHLSQGYSLIVTPYMDDSPHGVFATRAPKRPNPIGLSVVKLLSVRDNILEIEDVDIVDGTPLLDIKPYVPDFDIRKVEKFGWLEEVIHKLSEKRDDGRFLS